MRINLFGRWESGHRVNEHTEYSSAALWHYHYCWKCHITHSVRHLQVQNLPKGKEKGGAWWLAWKIKGAASCQDPYRSQTLEWALSLVFQPKRCLHDIIPGNDSKYGCPSDWLIFSCGLHFVCRGVLLRWERYGLRVVQLWRSVTAMHQNSKGALFNFEISAGYRDHVPEKMGLNNIE